MPRPSSWPILALLSLPLLASSAWAQQPQGALDKTPPALVKRLDQDLAAYWRGQDAREKLQREQSDAEWALGEPPGEQLTLEQLLERWVGYRDPILTHLHELLQRRTTISLRRPILEKVFEISPARGEEFMLVVATSMRAIDTTTRELALQLLEPIATPRSGKPLLNLLEHPRTATGLAVGRCLVAIASRNPKFKSRLREVITKRLHERETEGDRRGASALVSVYVDLAPPGASLDYLLRLLSLSHMRRIALNWLTQRLGPSAWTADELESVAPPVRNRLLWLLDIPGSSQNDRQTACRALGLWGDYSCVEPLLELLEVEEDREKEQVCASIRAALAQVTGRNYPTFARWEAHWKTVASTYADYDEHRARLSSDRSRPAVVSSLRALSKIRQGETFRAIDRFLADVIAKAKGGTLSQGEQIVVEEACKALATLRDDRGAGTLISVVASPKAQRVRKLAKWALGIIAGKAGPITAGTEYWMARFPSAALWDREGW